MTALQHICDGIEKFCGVDLTSSDQHLTISGSRVQQDNDYCKKMVEWFKHYNPFLANSNLISLSTGVVGDSRINCHMAKEEGILGIKRMEGMLCLQCWDNCNNRKIQVINSDDDDDVEPILPDHLVEASLSLHDEEDTDYLPKDIGP
ncbi:hypothetical protein AVEN_202127-1 [Araneus ventricosus]|uniref:Uncharacterized protein n=1 Tax=Araneus ventricosus TaxID=182803 RepID=A0A4Y2E1A6_ARAVE|nr:hypothetical protein AVEN_202127-1 [Araneus ventricosus]